MVKLQRKGNTQNYLYTFQKVISWEDMIKNRETAWLSMKDTLLHIMSIEIHGLIIRSKDSRIQIDHFHIISIRHGML